MLCHFKAAFEKHWVGEAALMAEHVLTAACHGPQYKWLQHDCLQRKSTVIHWTPSVISVKDSSSRNIKSVWPKALNLDLRVV